MHQAAEAAECARALAFRLQQATRQTWDEDRCIAEAEQFMRSLQTRGWRHSPQLMAAPTWRDHKTPEPPNEEFHQARAALRGDA